MEPADHSEDFAHRYANDLDLYCAQRMKELGIPDDMNGADDPYRRTLWRAFVAEERTGGHLTSGITVNSGVLNPKLFKGSGSRVWAKSRLKDCIDAVIAHEWEEYRHDTHGAALKEAPKTDLPITPAARRILRAMSR
jgi:hypothetical protein